MPSPATVGLGAWVPLPPTSTKAALACAPDAYLTALLHATKYPDAGCFGLLLADPRGDLGVGTTTHITRVLPLFHGPLLESPMLQVALEQAERFADRTQGVICGCYYVPVDSRAGIPASAPPPRTVSAIATHIATNAKRTGSGTGQGQGASLLLLVDMAAVRDQEECAISTYALQESGSWAPGEPKEGGTCSTVESRKRYEELHDALLTRLIPQGAHRELVDFDDHLEEIGRSWLTNERLSEAMALVV